MARRKVTLYVSGELIDSLKMASALRRRSVSDLVEDAIGGLFSEAGRHTEHAVLMARLAAIERRLAGLQRAEEVHFELTAQSARFAMSIAPEISEDDRLAANARGSHRFRLVLRAIVSRLAAGRSVWRDSFASPDDVAEAPAAGEPDTARKV